MPMQLLDFVEGTQPSPDSHFLFYFIAFLLHIPYLLGIFLYILEALGLHRIAKRRGICCPWLAWVPCGRNWLLGSISDQYNHVAFGKKRYLRAIALVLAILTALAIVLDSIRSWELPLSVMNLVYTEPVKVLLHSSKLVALLLGMKPWLIIVLLAVRLLAIYQLYRSSLPDRKLPLLILNILVPFSPAVTIFAVRNHDQGMPPDAQLSPVSRNKKA